MYKYPHAITKWLGTRLFIFEIQWGLKYRAMSVIYSQTEVYHILDVLGKGTFGKVLKCVEWRSDGDKRQSDGQMVAVKSFSYKCHWEPVDQKWAEADCHHVTVQLQGESYSSFFEAFCDTTQHYLVFEMLEKNLYELQPYIQSRFRNNWSKYLFLCLSISRSVCLSDIPSANSHCDLLLSIHLAHLAFLEIIL